MIYTVEKRNIESITGKGDNSQTVNYYLNEETND